MDGSSDLSNKKNGMFAKLREAAAKLQEIHSKAQNALLNDEDLRDGVENISITSAYALLGTSLAATILGSPASTAISLAAGSSVALGVAYLMNGRFFDDQRKIEIDLKYKHACAKLTDEQFSDAIEALPGVALSHDFVCARMTDEQFKKALTSLMPTAPVSSKAFDEAFDEAMNSSKSPSRHSFVRISDETFEAMKPSEALSRHSFVRVTDEMMNEAFSARVNQSVKSELDILTQLGELESMSTTKYSNKFSHVADRIDSMKNRTMTEGIEALLKTDLTGALKHPFICAHLSEDQFTAAAKREPYAALAYEHACTRLSDAQFAEAVKAEPSAALEYAHAFDRLSDRQFDVAVATRPDAALWHERACDKLSDEQFTRAFNRLDKYRREEFCRDYPHIADRLAQIEAVTAAPTMG